MLFCNNIAGGLSKLLVTSPSALDELFDPKKVRVKELTHFKEEITKESKFGGLDIQDCHWFLVNKQSNRLSEQPLYLCSI